MVIDRAGRRAWRRAPGLELFGSAGSRIVVDGQSYELRQFHFHEPCEEHLAADVSINLADMLPANRGYYTFPGSLSTPPCSENVTWYVLKTPVQLSAEQISLNLRALRG